MPTRAHEIQEQQGWTDDTMLYLAYEFIANKKLWIQWEEYLRRVADDENKEASL